MTKKTERIEIDMEQVLPFTARKFIAEMYAVAVECGYDIDVRVKVQTTLENHLGAVTNRARLQKYLSQLDLEGLPFGVRGDMTLE